MKENKLLYSYRNGNVDVEIFEDGTKTREWSDETPWAEYPESADVKITNNCSLGSGPGGLNICHFCHEQSNTLGAHADLSLVEKIWSTQKPGTEMAIGGGNPLSHPDIIPFLKTMKSYGIISNITMNMLHIKEYASMIKQLQDEKLIYGMGVSYRGPASLKYLSDDIDYKNVVFHLITGINDLSDCKAVIEWCRARNIKPKILMLGFKQFGLGKAFYSPSVQQKIDAWKNVYLKELFKIDGIVISFDNLGLEQVALKDHVSKELWDTHFQGHEGDHTFFLDSVKQEFTRNSTATERFKFDGSEDIRDLFNKVRAR